MGSGFKDTRLTTVEQEPQKFENIRYHHFALGEGHCTIAYQLDQNKDAKQRKIRYSCAYSSPRDQFSKKIGRAISEGRLKKGLYLTANLNVEDSKLSGSTLFQVLQHVRQLAFDIGPQWKGNFLPLTPPRVETTTTKE